MQRHYNIPIFLPEAACPFRCVYCNQYSIAGQQSLPSPNDVCSYIDAHLASFKEDDRYVEVAFFGGNFTGLPVKAQNDYMTAVQPYLESGQVQSLRCSTRPDYINEDVLKRLKQFGMKHIELGAQSTDDDVLRRCGRGHSYEDIKHASQLINDAGFILGLQMMLGLPNSSAQKDMQTARDIVTMGAKETRIYPCIVVKNTGLASDFAKGRYTPLSLDEAATLSADVYSYFVDNGVTVLRVGLHASDELDSGDFIAGPYHHNFAEMVMSELWHRRLKDIKGNGKKITIATTAEQRTNAIGYKASNKKMLEKRFLEAHFIVDNNLKGFQYLYDVEQYGRPIAVVSSLIPDEARKNLAKMAELQTLEPVEGVYKTINTHPDIFMFPYDINKVVFAPNTPSTLVANLHQAGISMTKGTTMLGKKHPDTIAYNACLNADLLIHNKRYTDKKILDVCPDKKFVDVTQAYTRCNLIAIGEKAFVTSDKMIEKTLLDIGLDVLFIDPHQVTLQGHEYGFFPGCCGIYDNTLYVCGTTTLLKEKKQLDALLNRNGFRLVELWQGPLTDIGSIFFLTSGTKTNK